MLSQKFILDSFCLIFTCKASANPNRPGCKILSKPDLISPPALLPPSSNPTCFSAWITAKSSERFLTSNLKPHNLLFIGQPVRTSKKCKSNPITTAHLRTIQWLSIMLRIKAKLLMVTHKTLHILALYICLISSSGFFPPTHSDLLPLTLAPGYVFISGTSDPKSLHITLFHDSDLLEPHLPRPPNMNEHWSHHRLFLNPPLFSLMYLSLSELPLRMHLSPCSYSASPSRILTLYGQGFVYYFINSA